MWQLLIMLLANQGLVSSCILIVLCPGFVNLSIASMPSSVQACWGFGLYCNDCYSTVTVRTTTLFVFPNNSDKPVINLHGRH